MVHHEPAGCPRCGSSRIGGTAARAVCGRCGTDWQAAGTDRQAADSTRAPARPCARHRAEPDPETPDGRDQHSGADPWDRPELDDLGSAAVTVHRLRHFLHGPATPAERAAARRFLDTLAEQ